MKSFMPAKLLLITSHNYIQQINNEKDKQLIKARKRTLHA